MCVKKVWTSLQAAWLQLRPTDFVMLALIDVTLFSKLSVQVLIDDSAVGRIFESIATFIVSKTLQTGPGLFWHWYCELCSKQHVPAMRDYSIYMATNELKATEQILWYMLLHQ